MLFDPNDALIHELKRIADAVSKPAPSPWLDWLKTLASFIAGLAIAYFSQQFQSSTSDRREKRKMRRIVYFEISKNFMDLNSIVSPYWRKDGTPILKKMRYKILNQGFLTFEGELYMKENTAVFYQLEEGEILKWIYYWFHRLDIPKIDGSNKFGLAELRGPLSFFSDRFRDYPVFRRHLKKMISPTSFKFIENTTKCYKHVFSMEELIDSGLMIAVNDDGSSDNVEN
jgi:hypothetical protein